MEKTFLRGGLCCILLYVLFAGPARAADWVYHAKDGDTLWHLCLQYTNKRGCWIELARYNQIDHDRRIPVGAKIKFPLSWLRQAPTVGKVTHVNGDVYYRQHREQSFVNLVQGQEVHLGGRLKTIDGSASLLLDNRHRILLRPATELVLDVFSPGQATVKNAGQSEINLQLPQGSIKARVDKSANSQFQIETPAAIAAVRGTEFRVISDSGPVDNMRVEVLSGAVAVLTGKQNVEVQAGFGVAVKKDAPVALPRQLLEAPVFNDAYSRSQLPLKVGWGRIDGAASYRLELFVENDQGGMLVSHHITQQQHLLTDLASGCYQLQVSAVDPGGLRGLSSQTPLCVLTKLAVPSLNAVVRVPGSKDILYDWEAVPNAERYRVELAADESFNEVFASYVVDQPHVLLQGQARQNFYIRVIAHAEKYLPSDPSATVKHKPSSGKLTAIAAFLLIVLSIF